MATYNKEYRYNPPRRKKQRYALVERVVDFSKAPVTAGVPDQPNSSNITTAWAAGDILQAIAIRAGQTVLGVEFELLTRSTTSNANIRVGYGSDNDYWGKYDISKEPANNKLERASSNRFGQAADQNLNFGQPLYFSSADTIDIVINKAITAGRIRLIVHLVEDDR